MRVLSVVHGPEARAGLFEPVVVGAGHAIDEWSFSWERRPPRPLESYDAYMVFGGAMHPDQEDRHTWLPQEIDWLERILADGRPVLGVCRSEEHTSELQSHSFISYAVFCLKKKK